MKTHRYVISVEWTGNLGDGTSHIATYARQHRISAAGKPTIEASSDPSFRGDPTRWNPEELLLASLAACHELWYLGLCAQAGVSVEGYIDHPEGVMVEEASRAGQFERVTLRPRVTINPVSSPYLAKALHDRAHAMCFIARSVKFPVHVEASITNHRRRSSYLAA